MMSPTDCKPQTNATSVSAQLGHNPQPGSTMLGEGWTPRPPLIYSGTVTVESLSNFVCYKGNATGTQAP